MQTHEITSEIMVCTGTTLASNATIIRKGRSAILIDALASDGDARDLHSLITRDLDLEIRFIICTHYFSDHLAALRTFPDALVIAHRYFLNTFYMEDYRSPEEAQRFRAPDVLVDTSLTVKWGIHTLELFHNPGHTLSTLNIDIPEADLVLCSDNAVGNIAYFHYSHPDTIRDALLRLKRHGRGRVIPGHGGVVDQNIFDHAIHYIDTLHRRVLDSCAAMNELSQISLASCLSPGLNETEFEDFFHQRNLTAIAARRPFPE